MKIPEDRVLDLAVPLVPGRRIDLRREVLRRLDLEAGSLGRVRILRRSVDARRKNRIRILFRLEIAPPDGESAAGTDPGRAGEIAFPDWSRSGERRIGSRPVVVGAGPGGLFAALGLALKGYRPLVLERGAPLAPRIDAVRRFWREGILDPETNVPFGEGGAGTFSDGKLTTRSKHPLVRMVFEVLVRCGAPPSVLYEQKPHLGTEKVRAVVRRLRRRIEELGGSFHFETRLCGLRIDSGRVRAVETGRGAIETDAVFLAIGHSARDTYRSLADAGVLLEPKPFAVGLRVEHDQDRIDRAQYGDFAGHPELGPADYRLSWTDPASRRGVYSFCNCPGGRIIAASNEAGAVVTNGMSRFRRDSGLSNAALVVSVLPSDFGSADPLAGLDYQRAIEERAFRMGGGAFVAPAQATRSFLRGRTDRALRASYRPGVCPADLAGLLPGTLVAPLREAIRVFSRRIAGFADSVLVGPETRTSSPVRIVRHRDSMESLNVRGLFPVGEGAGYAGGIVSSAVDGLRAVSVVRPRRSLP